MLLTVFVQLSYDEVLWECWSGTFYRPDAIPVSQSTASKHWMASCMNYCAVDSTVPWLTQFTDAITVVIVYANELFKLY